VNIGERFVPKIVGQKSLAPGRCGYATTLLDGEPIPRDGVRFLHWRESRRCRTLTPIVPHRQSGPGVAMGGTRGRRRWSSLSWTAQAAAIWSLVGELAQESSRGRNRSREARRESFYGRIAAHGEDPGTWPPCSEMVDAMVDGVRAHENDPQCATDIWGPHRRSSRRNEALVRGRLAVGPSRR
jgi:hypothetical protein